MPIAHLLEEFSDISDGTAVTITDVMIEEQKLASFEKGYQAGWDDSARAQQDSSTRISEDFARNIRDLSFTYQEAHGAFVADMEPLIRDLVNSVLPKLAQETLGRRITDILTTEVEAQGQAPVLLVTAPGQSDALQAILPETTTMPVEIVEDATLADGQVQLRFGGTEREIDLAKVLETIGAAVEGFFQEAGQPMKETA